MSHKASLACAGAFAAAATLAGISPALSHTIVGNRLFPATLDIDDPGVNDEFTAPAFSYVPNPDGSNAYGFGFQWQKTITADLSFFIGDTFTHLTHTVKPDGTDRHAERMGQYRDAVEVYVLPKRRARIYPFGLGPRLMGQHWQCGQRLRRSTYDPHGEPYVGKGFGDVETEWLRPFAVTGEMDYSWSTHPIDFSFDPVTGLSVSQTPTFLTYGATLQYSLLYMNAFVHEVPEFFRQLIPTMEFSLATPVSNIGPSVQGSIPGTHQTTGTWGPGIYYLGRLGPISFEVGAVAQIPINSASGRHVGALAILDFFLDDMFPDSIGKPIFGPRQPRPSGTF